MKLRLFKIIFLGIVILFSGLLGEGLLRLINMQPHQLKIPQIVSHPGHVLNPHPQLGLALKPGNYEVSINGAPSYQCTHLEDATRATSLDKGQPLEDGKKIFVFGCSFTYGMGVSDSLTFPFLLQSQFPVDQVYNFGVPAYGTVQSYLQLQTQLKNGHVPDLVVLNYASLHDGRNKLSIAQQKYWREAFLADTTTYPELLGLARFPYVNKIPHADLAIQYLGIPDLERRWAWSHFSALINLVEIVVDHIIDGFEDKHLISQKIILEFLALCKDKEIPLIVTGITDDKTTHDMLEFCIKQNIPTLPFGVDLNDKRNTLYPYDNHPNAAAHRIYAAKLFSFLENFEW